jgi:Fe-S cluster biogenesis protein NfuA
MCEATRQPMIIRLKASVRKQTSDIPPQLSALVDEGVLERAEIGLGEVRTWLGAERSWAVDGPRVRSALFDALSRGDDDSELSDEELRDRIEEILAREVAPIAGAHGGAIRVDSVRDGVLTVALAGACLGCALSGRTIGDVVARSVRTRYPRIREVKTAPPQRVWLTLSRKRKGR